MKAVRLIYNPRTNSLDETEISFYISRVEWFEILKWSEVYEDELEEIKARELYGELFEEDTTIKILLKMKNGEEVIIDFDAAIHEKLKQYFA